MSLGELFVDLLTHIALMDMRSIARLACLSTTFAEKMKIVAASIDKMVLTRRADEFRSFGHDECDTSASYVPVICARNLHGPMTGTEYEGGSKNTVLLNFKHGRASGLWRTVRKSLPRVLDRTIKTGYFRLARIPSTLIFTREKALDGRICKITVDRVIKAPSPKRHDHDKIRLKTLLRSHKPLDAITDEELADEVSAETQGDDGTSRNLHMLGWEIYTFGDMVGHVMEHAHVGSSHYSSSDESEYDDHLHSLSFDESSIDEV